MFARIPSASLSHWGRVALVSSLLALPVFASCTKSEDTEPFVPAVEGARQPGGEGDLVSEEDACARLLDAAKEAYDRLGCDAPTFRECPAFLRPGGGSGCYEYYDDSVTACVESYEEAPSCRELSPCLATAERNDTLDTCEVVDDGTGGAGGAGTGGGGPVGGAGGAPSDGGAPPVTDAGAAGMGGAAAGQSAGGANN